MKWAAFADVRGLNDFGLFKLMAIDEHVHEPAYESEALRITTQDDHVAIKNALSSGRYTAVVADSHEQVPRSWSGPTVTGLTRGTLEAGDCFSVSPTSRLVRVLYRRASRSNVLFTTGRCNSLCLMCSQPPTEDDDGWRVQELCRLIPLLDRDIPEIGISGGEPTLLGVGLVSILEALKEHRPNAAIHLLSNARLLGSSDLPARIHSVGNRDLMWGIPLLGDTPALHDRLMGVAGSFREALRGIHHLLSVGQKVEIRVVLQRPLIARLPEIARFIFWSVPNVSHVTFMGLEPIGYAKRNWPMLDLHLSDHHDALRQSVQFLVRRGIRTSIYNAPLCVLPADLWPYARQSISDWKQKYLPQCSPCSMKASCGGFFEWTSGHGVDPMIRPLTLEEDIGLEI